MPESAIIEFVPDLSPPPPRRLSGEIDDLLAALSERPICLREIITVIHGRAYTLLLIFLALPFCLPVPLPGLSTVLGAIIALIGLRLSLRLEPWLPARVLDRRLSAQFVSRVLIPAKRLARTLEVLLRPRWSFLVEWTLLHHLNGAMICVSGLLLMLPLPVPFSNILPALTIIFLAAAMLERDGLFVILGILSFVFSLAFFTALVLGGAAAIQAITHWFSGVPPGD